MLYSNPALNKTYDEEHKQYLDLRPAIQLCIYNKEVLNFQDFRIIYPEYLCDDYS